MRISRSAKYLLYRNYSKSSIDESNSALAERFTQILESKLKDSSPSIIDNDPKLKELYNKYNSQMRKNEEFNYNYQAHIGTLKSESRLIHNRHARDIADPSITKPWTGSESIADASLRTLVDATPKNKGYRRKKINSSERLANAKGSSLDFKLHIPPEDNFRDLFKEKLLGPSMLLNANSPSTSIGLVESMAEAKVNSMINRKNGKFDDPLMENVRGRPLSREHLANCTDSNYFMNQILNKHDILPPWIENQQGMGKEINRFRDYLDEMWSKCLTERLSRKAVSKEQFLHQNSIDHIDDLFNLSSISGEIPYLTEKVNSVNGMIRDYNLQSPSVNFHKHKLLLNKELRDSFNRVRSNFADDYEKRIHQIEESKIVNKPLNRGKDRNFAFLGLFKNDGTKKIPGNISTTYAKPQEKVHLWKEIKSMFIGNNSS